MKTKQRTLIVLLVLVFLAGGAFATLTVKNEQAAQAESAAAEGAIPLSSFAAGDLTELAVTYNGETNTLTVADGSWTLAEDPAYHLDATACNTMVTALSALNAKRQLTEEPGEDYGFTDASLTVTVTAAGETNTFTFGAENAATGDIHLKKAGDDALYTVAASKAACFALSRAALFGAFNPAGLTRSAIESVTLVCGDEPFTLTAVSEAAESDRSADSESDSTAYTTVWRLADAPDVELDETQVSSLLSALSSYVTAQDPHGDASGMKQLAAATVRTADGERTLTYYEGTDGYYLTVSGDASLYTVDAATVQTVCTAKDRYKAAS
jgi:hypothetical protein